MNFFKKRKTAVAVFAAVVILFSLIGCHLSLSRACGRVEDAFFDKAELSGYDYYTAPGDQLNACLNYANRLLSVINGSDELTEGYVAVRDSRQALADALESRDISDIYAANAKLCDAVTAVDRQVQAGASLMQSHDDYDAIVSDFFSAQGVAANSPYNEYVDDFIRETVRPFPTGILRLVSFVSLPERFE